MTPCTPQGQALLDALAAGDWTTAITLAESDLALLDQHRDAQLWQALGHAYAGENRYEQAVDVYSKARMALPDHDLASRAELLYDLRVARAKLRSLTMLGDFDQERTATPEDDERLVSRIGALWDLNRYEDAFISACELTARGKPIVPYWILRGRLARIVTEGVACSDELEGVVQVISQLVPDDPIARVVCADLMRPKVSLAEMPRRMEEQGFQRRAVNGVEVIVPPVQDIPAGAFLMGSRREEDADAYPDEAAQHPVMLPRYAIGRYPVTVAEYAHFVQSGHRAPPGWRAQLGQMVHPVTQVTWHDATTYADWLAECTGQKWRLPTEAEWEKAARWDEAQQIARIYPWGDSFDPSRCVTYDAPIRVSISIGSLPANKSAYGVMDMAGNVWEYTSSVYRPYPYDRDDGREAGDLLDDRVARGGAHNLRPRFARTACRGHRGPIDYGEALGFRLVRS